MATHSTHKILSTLLVSTIVAGCSNRATNGETDLRDHDLEIIQLRLDETKDPSDWRIKRDLGIAYFRTNQVRKAIDKLTDGYKLNPEDSRALLFLGLSYEKLNVPSKAISFFERCASKEIRPSLRQELQARVRENMRNRLRNDVRQRLRDFRQRKQLPMEPRRVAVLYFRNISEWDELDPLTKGLTELIANDLRKIRELTVVDRLEVQFLLEELQITADDFFDRIQSANVGRLLGAGLLVSGGVERLSKTEVQINSGLVLANNGKLQGNGARAEGDLSEIVALAKKIVLRLVDDFRLRLSEAEYRAIQQPPTRSSLAFIAFSKGLDFEDKRLFELARDHYGKAVQLDPNFILAKEGLSVLSETRLSISEMARIGG